MGNPLAVQIDLKVSSDTVDVRNDLQQGPHSQVDASKKTEYML